ncbi:sulfotransferase 1E1-like [Culicoides brevitarsis]|uniref:sulfotransferase 1E1-like n=1 Tax=Culicoides brevitarsis TaxID=469753 RepID=UPI00307C23E6
MSIQFTIERLPDKANNFAEPPVNQSRFILTSCSQKCPLTREQCEKFSNTVLPARHEKYLEEIKNLEIYEDDTWVISYPKCGTTWTQETVWQISNDVDLDSEQAKKSLRTRFPFIEASSLMAENPEMKSRVQQVKEMPRPRFVKSHLPICFLPDDLWKKAKKIIYVARDPKDAAVSYFHHYFNLHEYQGTIEEYLDLYLEGNVEFGDYWDHVEQFHLIRHLPNFKFIKFEDLKHNLRATLVDLANFLGKSLSEEQLEKLEQHLQFENIKNNPAVNYSLQPPPEGHVDDDQNKRRKEFNFIRRGQTGSHRDEMPQEIIERFDKKTKERFGGYENLY